MEGERLKRESHRMKLTTWVNPRTEDRVHVGERKTILQEVCTTSDVIGTNRCMCTAEINIQTWTDK